MRLLALRTVLVATDLDDSAAPALQTADRLARAAGATLHVVHVPRPSGAETKQSGRSSGPRSLAEVVRGAGVTVDETRLYEIPGDPPGVVEALASRLSASVIVLGPHRRRASTRASSALGSTAQAIAARASAPCLIASHPLRLPLGNVLVPSDLSETARGALIVGLTWASALRGEGTMLTALHVTGDGVGGESTGTRTIDDELQIVREHAGSWAGVGVHGATVPGVNAAASILQRAAEMSADLIVLGTRGLGLDAAARVGSVSTSVVTSATANVLLVPAAVWRTHVGETAHA